MNKWKHSMKWQRWLKRIKNMEEVPQSIMQSMAKIIHFLTNLNHDGGIMSQPYFEGSVRMKLTFSKLGLGNPPGLLKLQSSITGVKSPCIGVFFISLESY